MKLLKEVSDKDIGYNYINELSTYRIRKASRAIVMNDKGEIAILYVSKHNYHKLPGGGIEAGEDIQTALIREVMEEAGVDIDILGEIGAILEYRNKHQFFQISYCFYAKVKGDCRGTSFTDEEINDGFELIWVPIDKAIEIVENDITDDYVGKFIQKRDLVFLKEAYLEGKFI
jgi:8-oxo-dGTP pyrophosphatase MutT (NUDIX family)